MEFKQPLANNWDWAEVKTNTIAVFIAVDMQHNSVIENMSFKHLLKETEPFNMTPLTSIPAGKLYLPFNSKPKQCNVYSYPQLLLHGGVLINPSISSFILF